MDSNVECDVHLFVLLWRNYAVMKVWELMSSSWKFIKCERLHACCHLAANMLKFGALSAADRRKERIHSVPKQTLLLCMSLFTQKFISRLNGPRKERLWTPIYSCAIQPCILLLAWNQGATAFLLSLEEEWMSFAPSSRIVAVASHLHAMRFDADASNFLFLFVLWLMLTSWSSSVNSLCNLNRLVSI